MFHILLHFVMTFLHCQSLKLQVGDSSREINLRVVQQQHYGVQLLPGPIVGA